MTWNYRVLKGEDSVSLIEVYYNDNGEVFGWVELEDMVFDSYKELLDTLHMMLGDAEKGGAVIRPSELPGYED